MTSAGTRMLSGSRFTGLTQKLFGSHERATLSAAGILTAGLLAKDAAKPLGGYARQAYKDMVGGTSYVPKEYHNPYWLGTKSPYL